MGNTGLNSMDLIPVHDALSLEWVLCRVDNPRPITSRVKGYPFEVLLPATSSVSGVVLADQVKSLDWRARRARFESHAPRQVVGEALEQISVLLE